MDPCRHLKQQEGLKRKTETVVVKPLTIYYLHLLHKKAGMWDLSKALDRFKKIYIVATEESHSNCKLM